ncbi:hypothetical protein ABPG74_007960, partial [Tetrahymena malaccensis]
LTDEYKEQEKNKNIPTAFEAKFKDYIEKQYFQMINSDQDQILNHQICITQEEVIKDQQREQAKNINTTSLDTKQTMANKFNTISRKKKINQKNVIQSNDSSVLKKSISVSQNIYDKNLLSFSIINTVSNPLAQNSFNLCDHTQIRQKVNNNSKNKEDALQDIKDIIQSKLKALHDNKMKKFVHNLIFKF